MSVMLLLHISKDILFKIIKFPILKIKMSSFKTSVPVNTKFDGYVIGLFKRGLIINFWIIFNFVKWFLQV